MCRYGVTRVQGLGFRASTKCRCAQAINPQTDMNHSLNSSKGLYRVLSGTTPGVVKGDTRSLDTGSHEPQELTAVLRSWHDGLFQRCCAAVETRLLAMESPQLAEYMGDHVLQDVEAM